MTPKKKSTYVYTKLADIQPGCRLNVYGVLEKVLKANSLTTTGKFHSMLHLLDETLPLEKRFRMHIFSQELFSPEHLVPGNIFRFHRVKVENFEGTVDGRVFSSNDVVTFPQREDSNKKFFTSAKLPHFSDDDWNRVSFLRDFSIARAIFPDDDEVLLTFHNRKSADEPAGESAGERANEPVEELSNELADEPAKELAHVPVDEPANEHSMKKLVLNPFNSHFKKLLETLSGHEGKRSSELPETSSNKKLHTLMQTRKLMKNENAHENSCNLTGSMHAEEGSSASVSQELACAQQKCTQIMPVLLKDDDPRLAGFDESSLMTEGLGDIPGVDENGQIICRQGGFLPPADPDNAIRVTGALLKNFQWPRQTIKVKIVNVKPRLQDLQSHGPKNLLSGTCARCGFHTMYSSIVWDVDKETKRKRPKCLTCHKDGVCSYVCLELRLRLTVKDAWGASLNVHVVKPHASTFLGCSAKEYQQSDECRRKIVLLLSKGTSSNAFFTMQIFRANTFTRTMFYVCNTVLSDMLS